MEEKQRLEVICPKCKLPKRKKKKESAQEEICPNAICPRGKLNKSKLPKKKEKERKCPTGTKLAFSFLMFLDCFGVCLCVLPGCPSHRVRCAENESFFTI